MTAVPGAAAREAADDAALVAAVRDGLAAAADPERAPGMQAYMKSAMPFRGVPAPGVRRIATAAFRAHPLPDRAAWEATVRALWHGARFREERYAAVALTGAKPYRAYDDAAAVPLYDELIVDGAWWDLVDEIAIRRLGPILAADRAAVEPVIRAWSTDGDRWRRRTAIIVQVGAKGDTDLDLLQDVIAPNLADRDFFVRKAIGWALRQYAWVDPAWVRSYVAAHGDALSGLSRREALKNVGP